MSISKRSLLFKLSLPLDSRFSDDGPTTSSSSICRSIIDSCKCAIIYYELFVNANRFWTLDVHNLDQKDVFEGCWLDRQPTIHDKWKMAVQFRFDLLIASPSSAICNFTSEEMKYYPRVDLNCAKSTRKCLYKLYMNENVYVNNKSQFFYKKIIS